MSQMGPLAGRLGRVSSSRKENCHMFVISQTRLLVSSTCKQAQAKELLVMLAIHHLLRNDSCFFSKSILYCLLCLMSYTGKFVKGIFLLLPILEGVIYLNLTNLKFNSFSSTW